MHGARMRTAASGAMRCAARRLAQLAVHLPFTLLLSLLLVLPAPHAHAQAGTLSVGLALAPPFVMEEGGKYTGIAVDLWEELAARKQLHYAYRRYADFGQLLEAVSHGEIDVAISSLTINQERAQRMDFTQPWFDGGMRIMVSNVRGDVGLRDFFLGMQRAGFAAVYGWIAIGLLVATVLFTLFDRHFDSTAPRRWPDGLAEGFYTATKFAATGQTPLRKNFLGWPGRVWQALMLLIGVAVVAFVTSSVTSIMTTQTLRSRINGLADLAGVQVGVLTGTVEESFARAQGLSVQPFPDLEQASRALRDGAVRAVLADGPMLEYHVHRQPGAGLAVVGPTFQRDRYGFALPRNSAMTEPLTLEVLGAIDRGRVEVLERRYFGAPP